tara:strand:- start:417 stop:557 length:141 start_codon:yes stop_codon:yes gene_type:complete
MFNLFKEIYLIAVAMSRVKKYLIMVLGGIILFLYQTCTGKLPPIGS